MASTEAAVGIKCAYYGANYFANVANPLVNIPVQNQLVDVTANIKAIFEATFANEYVISSPLSSYYYLLACVSFFLLLFIFSVYVYVSNNLVNNAYDPAPGTVKKLFVMYTNN